MTIASIDQFYLRRLMRTTVQSWIWLLFTTQVSTIEKIVIVSFNGCLGITYIFPERFKRLI